MTNLNEAEQLVPLKGKVPILLSTLSPNSSRGKAETALIVT